MKAHTAQNSIIVIMLLFLVAVAESPAQVGKLYPVDEASRDSSFLVFRQRLEQAVEQKDTDYIFSILHPEIETTHGVGSVSNRFKQAWSLDRPETRFWEGFEELLALGGTFSGDTLFIAPYVFSTWPKEYNPYIYQAVTGGNVPVYSSPETGSAIVTELSYDIVERSQNWFREHTGWIEIELRDGNQGFVWRNKLRGAGDYRAGFVKTEDGKWLLEFFVQYCFPPYPVAKLFPEDQAGRDSSFLSFRNRLVRAVENRDTSFIYSIMDPNIRVSFGEPNGISGFREMWRLDQESTCQFWEEISKVLSLGGCFVNDTTFVAPYVCCVRWPALRCDFDITFIVESDVPVYEEPDTSSLVIVYLTYDFVYLTREWWNWGKEWVAIKLLDGRPGFVRSRQSHMYVGMRAYFIKSGGNWRMTAFIGGD